MEVPLDRVCVCVWGGGDTLRWPRGGGTIRQGVGGTP